MDNDRLLIVVMVSMIIIGLILNYNLSDNRFGTNMTVIGILGLIIMKMYRDNGKQTTSKTN